MITLWCILFSFSIIFTYRAKKTLQKVSSFLNIFGLLLIVIPLITMFFKFSNTATASLTENDRKPIRICRDSVKYPLRDIYYIILDRYARADILKHIYNYDNSEFLRKLKNRGFYIASDSYANYPRTSLSLSSSLNMRYINYLSETQDENSRDSRPVCDLMNNHVLGLSLKSLGYSYLHFGSFHVFTRHCDIADINVEKYMIPEFSMTFYKTTLLYPFFEKLQVFNANTSARNSILYKLKKLKEVPEIKRTTFVFAHFLLPHLPYIFDKNGQEFTATKKKGKSLNEQYIEQLIFTNNQMIALIDTILEKSSIKPIIILQSDEGPFPSHFQVTPTSYKKFKYAEVPDIELKQKIGILHALRFPDIDTSCLYPTVSPVNSFRILFNEYFNSNIEILPDRVFAIRDSDHPYVFFEVTHRLFNPTSSIE